MAATTITIERSGRAGAASTGVVGRGAMAAVTGAPGTERRLSPLGVGVVVWLASELMFFSGLFAAYFTLRATDHPWPPAGVELSTARTGVATVVLIASSYTMHLASRAA